MKNMTLASAITEYGSSNISLLNGTKLVPCPTSASPTTNVNIIDIHHSESGLLSVLAAIVNAEVTPCTYQNTCNMNRSLQEWRLSHANN